MDGQHFDRFVKAWATRTTRRAALKVLAGGALAALIGGTRHQETEAADACGLVGAACAADADCCFGGRCNARGVCTCRTAIGFTPCPVAGGQRCFRLATDPRHCGACGARCAVGETCCGGVCRPPCAEGKLFDPASCACVCPSGKTNCNGRCVDLRTSGGNCGACGHTCLRGCCGGRCFDGRIRTCRIGQRFDFAVCACVADR